MTLKGFLGLDPHRFRGLEGGDGTADVGDTVTSLPWVPISTKMTDQPISLHVEHRMLNGLAERIEALEKEVKELRESK